VQKSLQITAITTLYIRLLRAHIHLKRGKAGGQLFARRRLALGIKSTFFIRFTYHYSPQQLGHEFDVSHFFPRWQLLSHSSEYIERAVSFFTLISSALDWQTAAPLERAGTCTPFLCPNECCWWRCVCVAVAATTEHQTDGWTDAERTPNERRTRTIHSPPALDANCSSPDQTGWLTSHTLDSIK
jgi:hypothetical protein